MRENEECRPRNSQFRCVLQAPSMLSLFLLILLVPSAIAISILSFSPPEADTTTFNHLIVHHNTGRVYIGAVNRIYQLQPNLELEVVEKTGPTEEDDCPVNRKCPKPDPMDNANKVLVIDYLNKRMITCGTSYYGLCNVRKLHNVSDSEPVLNQHVAGSTADLSTVAFVAPCLPNPPTTRMLYVGVTFIASGPERSEIPAVSSRNLGSKNLLSIASDSELTGRRVFLNSFEGRRHRINYVYGFTSGVFSYFLTTHLKSIDNPSVFVSKLVRICHDDPNYYSYTEIPIVCKSESPRDSTDYNLIQAAYMGKPSSKLATNLGITSQDNVLFAVFAQGNNGSDMMDKARPPSALCVFSLPAINRKFKENIQNCFYGNGETGLSHIVPSMKCVQTQLEISDDFCGMDLNGPLGGELPVVAQPIKTFKNTLLTAVAAKVVHEYTVVFLGTSTGHLLKLFLDAENYAVEYSDLEVDANSPVNPDLGFDPNKEHIYVMTERKVSRIKVTQCEEQRGCRSCIREKDPHCGWCTLEKKCSLKSECADASHHHLYWLQNLHGSFHGHRCTLIKQVDPPHVQRTTSRILRLQIDEMPIRNPQIICNFTISNQFLITDAELTTKGITCPTPDIRFMPPVPAGQHYFTSTLSVKSVNDSEFVATIFTFFDCATYSSCTECTSSPFPCSWCVHKNQCTHDTRENCQNDVLVKGINKGGSRTNLGPEFCPRIKANGGSNEILIPYDTSKMIKVKVENVVYAVAARFTCRFNFEGQLIRVNAQLLGDTVYCEGVQFKLYQMSATSSAELTVLRHGTMALDNPDKIHVLVYHCLSMAKNCGLCLTMPSKYTCGWCQSSGQCLTAEQCERREIAWLDRDKTCPHPRINDFFPKSGPVEGGTKITIHGINLGKTFEDIRNGVTVAGYDCIPTTSGYVPSSQIICEIKQDVPPPVLHEGHVIVNVEDLFRAESKEAFVYVNPVIRSFSPTKGPKSGGTTINITGEHLNAGSNIEVFINDFVCEVSRTTENWAECITTASDELQAGELHMKFDDGERKLNDIEFQYVHDPKIKSVEAGFSPENTPGGLIASGGIQITVRGDHFDVIQKAVMNFNYDGHHYEITCHVETSRLMSCQSPSIEVKDPLDADNPPRLELGFAMDHVSKYGNSSLFLYPNPEYFQFEGKNHVKYHKTDYLTINGKNLDLGCREVDIEVEIGTGFCQVTSLSRTQLTCRPPQSQPPAKGADGVPDAGNLPEVVVIVGDKLRYKIGYLSYQ